MSVFTGQIDLNLLQQKLGIGLQQLNEFINGKGIEAINKFIAFKETINLIFVGFIGLLLLFLIIKFIIEFKEIYEDDEMFGFIAMIIFVFIIFAVPLYFFLSRHMAPELTLIQYFTKCK